MKIKKSVGKLKKRSIVLSGFLILLLGLLPLLQACSSSSGSSSGKTVLKMTAWGSPGELKVYQKGIDAFEKENPDIEVKLTPVPSDSYEQKLITELAGGNGPDVFYVGDQTMAKLIENKSIVPLTDFMNTDKSYTKVDDYSEGLWGAAKQGDEIYGIPVDCNPYVIYYNRGLFKKLGIKSPQEYYDEGKWNWDAFREVTDKIKAAGKYGFVQDSGYAMINNWYWSNGGYEFDDKGNYVLDKDKKAQEALKFVNDLVQDGNAIYSGSLPEGQGADALFMSEQVGMVAAGHWLTATFKENKSLDYDYIYWPSNNGKKDNPVNIATAFLSVNAKSKHKEAAEKFATFYTSKQGQEKRLTGNNNAIPSVKGIDNIVTKDPAVDHIEYLLEGRKNGIANGAPQLYAGQVAGLQTEMSDIYDLMFLGKQDPEKTIQQITKVVNKEIGDKK
ncbi:multiple sugar transport system substrate-binding protein [Pullulanibacillus pueri]|uniref:Sugar ABC transporter substrate-binding protein n=1 Tax=Pullulanibacillus pueri TaxID=1437324 RepID=A0A8J3A4D0_9BACL|nr:sugar ABC transporter substrate-binding protein [Pullulanibacillus pueri]MBM7683019.1 multiple sugar transport system substrate-binding protein [Pullulanibacillus pueri]GGH89099.1 hypothetical protein GCM10007096_42920 [Pullulanibacillus pueri]